jgi:hydrogenase maturation protease
MTDRATGRTVVIGCGNLLGADDGVGLAVLERLRRWDLPPEVELADGGTWGLNLLPLIESTDRLLLLDAVDRGKAPGTVTVLEREEIPRVLSTKLSPHQIDLREVLALAELRGSLPRDMVVVGVQPARIELSTELSPEVSARVDDLVALAAGWLESWGHEVTPPTEACRA